MNRTLFLSRLLGLLCFFTVLCYGCQPAHRLSFLPRGGATDATVTDASESSPQAAVPSISSSWRDLDRAHRLIHRPERGMTSSMDAFLLPEETCSQETVSIPTDMPRSRVTLWHLCYELPTFLNSNQALARQLPAFVTVTRRDTWDGEPMEVIRLPVEPGTRRISVIVAVPLPPRGYALLNLRNEYAVAGMRDTYETVWAVQEDERLRALETHGVLTLACIDYDGTRLAWEFRPVVNGCVDALSPEFGFERGGSFLPEESDCPDMYYWCEPGRWQCAYEP